MCLWGLCRRMYVCVCVLMWFSFVGVRSDDDDLVGPIGLSTRLLAPWHAAAPRYLICCSFFYFVLVVDCPMGQSTTVSYEYTSTEARACSLAGTGSLL